MGRGQHESSNLMQKCAGSSLSSWRAGVLLQVSNQLAVLMKRLYLSHLTCANGKLPGRDKKVSL